MSFSRADELAMRRQLLMIGTSIQRLRLQRDVDVLASAANPATLVRRAWQQIRARPSLAVLPIAALLVLRRAGGRKIVTLALFLWQSWRRVQPGH